jgi:hypothetical protein
MRAMPLLLAVLAGSLSPLLGAYLAGRPLDPYLEFPPKAPVSDSVASFSWPAFLGLALFVAAVVVPPVRRLVSIGRPITGLLSQHTRPFPWWGWAAVGWLAAAWLLAWMRFEWFAPLQPYTFTPLWLGYIGAVNALAWRRTGHCWLTDRPLAYAGLFPLSAAFWWFFEYLNRYARNWHYLGIGAPDDWEYFLHGTLAFSTVLPAVAATHQWLAGFPIWGCAFGRWHRVGAVTHPAAAAAAIALSLLALAGLGIWPDVFYPFVWVAPLFLLCGFQSLAGQAHLFAPLARGDWHELVVAAVAGLVCGFFWELWNAGSHARWTYTVPHVQGFELFAMPLLGYAGYLPFGMLCQALVRAVAGRRGA